MDGNHFFYFKPWHFLSGIIVFYILTRVVAGINVHYIPESDELPSILMEVDKINLNKEGKTFLFFYRKDSGLCRKMRYNIEQLNVEHLQGIHFYAIDIEENSEYYYKYNISGIPNLLIFNGDIEANRVMGVVSTNNLEKIVNKINH
ncbi:thioredoxin family protein [Proteiniphilum sp.]|uniref:thioredoxin family protein n=1 Tax=Proteiniphilum sp. TaxID=1926877 RepID=UPI002B21055B|nr:thioredoxin family protein [Proteiniphilum sp.]MEA4917561.1 thioredoxin family protein [Proteiniphilum sp.]